MAKVGTVCYTSHPPYPTPARSGPRTTLGLVHGSQILFLGQPDVMVFIASQYLHYKGQTVYDHC